MDTTWVESEDGTRLAAYDFGGLGRPVLFAHATGFHAHTWLPVVRRLSEAFHCYAFDERGHGATPTPANGSFDWHSFGEDARAVAAAFGLERPLVAGHSAGGALLLLAEQAHPGTWSGVWTYEPVVPQGDPTDGGPNPLAAGARKRRSRFESLAAAYDNFASKAPFASLDPEALRAYVDHGFVPDEGDGVSLACHPEDEAATYEQARAHRAWDGLGAVEVPVWVACGADSTHFPSANMEAVADRLPKGTLEVLDGLGHFGPLEAPARIATSIRRAFD